MSSVQLLFGPLLIGSFLNMILYGVLVVQLFVYFQAYTKDARWIRLLMVYLFVLETINTGFTIATMYEPLVLHYGTPEATTFFPTVMSATPITMVFIAWRIWAINRSRLLTGAICLLALVAYGGGIWLTIMVIHIRRFSRKPELHWSALTWLLASAIADVLITITLTYSLSRRKTGFSNTDTYINKVIRLTVQTGMGTTIFAMLDVICFLVLPHTTINFIWDFTLSKLYTNALVSTLNARSWWRSNNVLFDTPSEYITATTVKEDGHDFHRLDAGKAVKLSRVHSSQAREEIPHTSHTSYHELVAELGLSPKGADGFVSDTSLSSHPLPSLV
ncbi:hypothetical protein AMATHDRAFT_87450 [Amanita thiersii Skay4041]|uniref:DUF6534 domain-containing protein n=1 Tax=Amanita thiersii Skay4041 TaxID=703135 RepID=A0A2A9NA40_9AGAR|nr:hypothetical protein AMATHDRAFT_87450 [Amanita thiersii Skay4041]